MTLAPLTQPEPLQEQDYKFIVDLVYERSRIHLGSEKRELVAARLGKRLRQLHIPSYADYCKFIRSPKGEEELTNLIDVISTNHTFFFREHKHFDFLAQHILPDFWKSPGVAPFRVWSAACSTGEEPYSIAICLTEHTRPNGSWSWTLDASDISTRVLAKAKAGIFPEDRLKEMRPETLKRFFKVVPGDPVQYQIKADLRAQLRFHHLNLFSATYPFREPFQVIFCRNVMIYFDRPTQETLVARLYQHLVPGGYLLVGHSESLTGIKHAFKMIKPAIYQKPVA